MGGIAKAVSSVVSGVGKAVSSVASSVGSAVSSTASGVDACGRKTINNLENAVSNVIKNPLPVIETLALTYALGPAGLAIGESATVAAVSSAAVSAANGGNIGDIATAAATSAAGSYAGQAAGTAVGAEIGSESSGAQLTTLGKITSSAVGGSTTTTLRLLADGSSFSDAVSAGAKVGVAAGITTGAIEGLKAGFDPSAAGTAPVVERSTGPGLDPTDATDTASSQNFPISPEVTVGKDPLSDPTIGPTESRLLASALYPAVYSTLFGKQQQAPVSAPRGTTATPTATAAPTQSISPTQTTAGPGTQALAQALRVGDAGAPIFGGDKEGGKKAGWNVESLRYMGNSEA